MIALPKRKKPTLGQLVFGEIVGPVDFDEDSDHPLRVDLPVAYDDMEAGHEMTGGLPQEALVDEDGDDALVGDASGDVLSRWDRNIKHQDSNEIPNIEKFTSPTDEPVDNQEMYKILQFDPKGPDHIWQLIYDYFSSGSSEKNVLPRFVPAYAVWHAESTKKKVSEFVAKGKFSKFNVHPDHPGHIDAIDAFRHALWSFKLARDVGPRHAMDWGNAHENAEEQSVPGERLMDLYNNNVGHRLAMDPRNKDREPEDVVMEALERGLLQTRPFNVQATERSSQKKQKSTSLK